MDRQILKEMLDILARRDAYFKSKVDQDMLVEWWAFFSKYESSDFMEGVGLYRFESNKFPTPADLDKRIIRVIESRSKSELEDRIKAHNQKKAGPSYEPEGKDVASQSSATCQALIWWLSRGNSQATEAAEKMRALSKDYPSNKDGFLAMASLIEALQNDKALPNTEDPKAVTDKRGVRGSKQLYPGFYPEDSESEDRMQEGVSK